MKKLGTSLLIITIIMTMFCCTSSFAAEADTEVYDTSSITSGVIGVDYAVNADVRTKVMIQKDSEYYAYDLFGDEGYEYFPLQLGSGTYEIIILENIEDTKYRAVYSQTISVKIINENDIYLNSIQNVSFDATSASALKAAELTEGLETDEEKFEAIYKYVISNISYDYAKISTLTSKYVPDADETLATGKGICYDYASLLGAMLRSQGIPTKLVKGYTDNVSEYHAWNEVYLNGNWVVVDTTYDAAMVSYNVNVTAEKDASIYRASKIY